MNSAPATKDTVRKAYEFALNHIGHDKESGLIWNDYIQFLKDLEVRCPYRAANMHSARVVGHDALGRGPEERCDQKSLPAGRANSDGQREAAMGRVAGMGKRPKQDHGTQ